MVATGSSSIKGLRRANRATAHLLSELAERATHGTTTRELGDYARGYMARLGAQPVFQTEEGFPGCINTSVNDVVVHGVPGHQRLQDGDVLSIDAGMLLDGYCGDSTVTVAIGSVGAQRQRLIRTAYDTMMAGIAAAVPGRRIGDIGYAMYLYARSRGFDIVSGYTGHGLGRRMHEEPSVPSMGQPGTGLVIAEGLVMTIEPILVEKSARVKTDADGWSVRTIDGGWAAQFEHASIARRRGTMILSAL